MEILFIRHGESTANKEKAFQGWTDVKLSREGREQAIKLSQHFTANNIQFDKIYSGPLQRALETAHALIPCSLNSDSETKEGLKSINVGLKRVGIEETTYSERESTESLIDKIIITLSRLKSTFVEWDISVELIDELLSLLR